MATAWRYVREAITLLATTADDLQAAITRICRLAYAILDGTLIPRPPPEAVRLRKHRHHSMNVQIPDATGRLVWASAALPGSTHDLTAARTHGIIDALTSAEVMTFADKAYQGAGGTVRTPFKRDLYRPKLSARQKAVNGPTPASAPAVNALSRPGRPGRPGSS